jgi:hypothetical protein
MTDGGTHFFRVKLTYVVHNIPDVKRVNSVVSAVNSRMDVTDESLGNLYCYGLMISPEV